MSRLLVIAVASLAVLLPGSSGATSGCTPEHLTASFGLVAGSQGAGNVTYELKLHNVSKTTSCTLSGRPGLKLYGAHGPLPTHEVADHPGTGTAVLVTLRPGRIARSEVRFSPDIPGKGEGNPCEPVAHKIKVTLPSQGAGSLLGPIKPPTRVCEHGRLVVGLLHEAG